MRFLSSLLLLAVVAVSTTAQTPEEIFQEGNRAYQAGKFAEAARIYESLRERNHESPVLYFNLGNSYYKAGNIPRAILNYERARRLTPSDDDLLHNLEMANLRITDRIEATPRIFIWDWWESAKTAMSLTGLTWWTYCVYLLLLIFLGLLFIARRFSLRRIGLLGSVVTGFILTVSLVVLVGRLSDLSDSSKGVLIAGIATIKNSPDERSSDAFVLHGGVTLLVTEQLGDWVKIRLPDGKVGWLATKNVELI